MSELLEREYLGAVDDSLADIAKHLSEIKGLLGELVSGSRQINWDPRYTADISEFVSFDWASIGAKPVAWDREGLVSDVEYHGRVYRRRIPDNKYPDVVLFSWHPPGEKNADGKSVYYWLIAFRKLPKVDPVPDGLKAMIGATAAASKERLQAGSSTPGIQAATLDPSVDTRFREWVMGFTDKSGAFRLPSGSPDMPAILLVLGKHGIKSVNGSTIVECERIIKSEVPAG